ncbi:hypothetical protein H9623_04400 [Oerskovia sp. Sa1BUA8]|uniref:Glycosyltransferase n=1 Tax=Oerskovia douganii TaxID=2762210 RepID=A0A9D5YXF6_9CELL|nr:hypothetical protein [Oerskovia douganii]MBE7699548.1 hypothetical protein [Oerskovia douganii]
MATARGALVRGAVGLYQRMPARGRRAVTWLMEHLPAAIGEHLAVLVLGTAARRPGPLQVPRADVRLYIAPANYAGQGYRWARAAERLPGVAAVNMAAVLPAGGFAFPVDYAVPQFVYSSSRSWQQEQRRAVERFSHVLIEACRPLFPRSGDGSAFSEARDLASHGVSVAMVCHGSEVRLPSRHAAAAPWSPFRDDGWKDVPALEALARRNREGLEASGLPVFVSTPDLLLDVPWATWLPVVVEPAVWATDEPPLERPVPVVVHVPSSGVIKGTSLIEPVLADLESRGLIEYRAVHGVPSAEMPAIYRGADIVLDQFRIGSYGVAACEAMAAGRVVVSHVDEQVRGHVRGVTGGEVPIVEATVETLEGVILGLLEDREGAREVAARGPGFVRDVHDGRASARALAGFLGVPAQV